MKFCNENYTTLNEMAYTRSDAIEICKDKGLPFIKHFHKCMNDLENNKNTFTHHANEMQSWWDNVKRIKLSHNNKHL